MTSAYASPPPFRFGPADLKAHARRFLHKALVISALAHLTAAGVFRAAQERLTEENLRSVPGKVFLVPSVFPEGHGWKVVPDASSSTGRIVPIQTITRPDPVDAGVNLPGPSFTGIQDDGGRGSPGGGGSGPEPPIDKMATSSSTVTPPIPIVTPKPVYPDWAREAGVEGKVTLRVLVGVDGTPEQVQVVSGPKGLDKEARDMVLRWKFKPGTSGKDSVEVWVEIPIVFRLAGD